jgi:Rrf2 family protein
LKLSVKSDYAVRAVLSLAHRHGSSEPVRVEVIAAENGIPPNYLVQILIELKSASLVKSHRGKDGGYQLARPPGEITFGEVIRAIHGPLLDTPAISDERCPAELKAVWRRLQAQLDAEADAVNFQQLADARSSKAAMFYI